MTYANTSPMPGAFNLTSQRDPAAPRLSGAKSHIFQPPRTRSDSASSSLILTRSTSTSTLSTNRPGLSARKRSRAESPRAEEEWAGYSKSEMGERCPASPRPFVSTKYVLAGGMDTPTLKAAQLAMNGDSEYTDITYRKSLATESTRRELFCDMEGSSYFPPDGRQGNGRPRGWNSPGADGWSKAAIQAVGGVAGKIWEFCKTGGAVFKGFQAGGGKGYTIENSETTRYHYEESESVWETEKHSTWGPPDRESTPVPGRFPDEEFIPDYLDHQTTPEARPAKRRQVSRNNTQDEIAKNWVVVPNTPVSNANTPSRPQLKGPSRYSMPTASSASRRSTAGPPPRPASRATFASATGPRRPLNHRVSHAGSPALTPNRGASFASPRPSPGSKIPRPSTPVNGSPQKAQDSPAAKEAQRWATLKKKEEREADESIRRLDRQLKAMIREGKEALGTKIEVEIEDEYDGSRKWDV